VIIALQDNTAFDAWPGAVGHELERFYERCQLTLGAGDALFFLGNAIHAGAGFQADNVRIHAFLDSNATARLRESDTTHFADVAAGVVGALPRDVRVAERIDSVD
jgi:ectoine hydroxylase-related dioxygenase (phytanoyl-CoA dioxygenase family)